MNDRAAADAPATQIRSVARASRLLLLVAHSADGIGATEAAKTIGTAVPTAYHLLNTLRVEGLLVQNQHRRFVLGPQAAVIADAWFQAENPPEFLLEPLRELARRTGETAYVAGWRQGSIQTLASVGGIRPVRVAEAEGGPYRFPHARATGKLLLALADQSRRKAVLGKGRLPAVTAKTITDRAALEAEFARIQAQGWAEDHEEFLEGVACLAAPVVASGVLVAALTVLAPSNRFEANYDALRDAVLDAASTASGERRDAPSQAA